MVGLLNPPMLGDFELVLTVRLPQRWGLGGDLAMSV
jgi:hypothetical protein